MDFETVIGLEVHVQLLTKTKIFCRCPTAFGAQPNSQVCPVCMGFPGALPVLNRQAVEFAIKLGLATHCQIAESSIFARKNYFYPDLPKGYQISQYEAPLCEKGWIEIDVNGQPKRIHITRIHMEEDAGKLIHESAHGSLVDYNRSSVPLLEVVSEPDMRSFEEAGSYLRAMRQVVRYLGISDGNMEEGSLRCDANISIRPQGEDKLGTKVELKNLNSFRFVEKALEYEFNRQREVVMSGGKVVQETRLFDSDRGTTHAMRGKEHAHDYRYFPDPDLLPLDVSQEWVQQVKEKLPELPRAKRDRFVDQLGIPRYDADILTQDQALAEFFERTIEFAGKGKAKQVSNWIMGEFLRALKEHKQEIHDLQFRPKDLAGLLEMIEAGTISGKIAKEVFNKMFLSGRSAQEIVKEEGLLQVSDLSSIESAVRGVIEGNPEQVAQYRGGKTQVFGFLVGQVMKATQGKANPKQVNEVLKRMLGG